MLTDHDKQAMGNREPAEETNKEDPTQSIPVWLQPFTENLDDLEGNASKVETQKRKHNVHAYFRKKKKNKRDLSCGQKCMVLKLVYFTNHSCVKRQETRAREDLSGIDCHPGPVSSSHVE